MGRLQQIRTAVGAGLTAGFCYALLLGAVELGGHLTSWDDEALKFVVVNGLVFLGLYVFLDPITVRMRRYAGVPEEHAIPAANSAYIRNIAIAILVVAGLSHALLHDIIENELVKTLSLIVFGLVLPGVTTFFWISGARSTPPRAAPYGAVAGAIGGFALAYAVYSVLQFVCRIELAQMYHPARHSHYVPLSRDQMDALTIYAKLDALQIGEIAVKFAAYWAIVGLAGGLCIDWQLGKNRARAVALALIIGSAVGTYVVQALPNWFNWQEPGITASEWAKMAMSFGWGLALVLSPLARAQFAIQSKAAPAPSPLLSRKWRLCCPLRLAHSNQMLWKKSSRRRNARCAVTPLTTS